MQRDVRTLPLGFVAVALSALMSSVLLPACGSTPNSRFYVLTATETSAAAEAATFKVGIEPVILPPSVDRAQLVMNVSANERSLWEFDRWAGPLAANMAQVLVLNLEARLGPTSTYTLPSRHAPPMDYIVTVEILQLDAYPDDDKLTMVARFHVADGQGKWISSNWVEMDEDHSLGPQGGAPGVVNAMSSGLGLISRIIAETLQGLPTATESSGS